MLENTVHGAHVEVVRGHDIVHVQVAFETEGVLVPAHALFQTVHSVVQLSHILFIAIYA